MGDVNQRLFLERLLPRVEGPVLEVGSKDYGSTINFRELYRGDYVGVDLEAGKGVDVVADLSAVMAENLGRLLRPGGALYISLPWVWRYHAYPDDYFRFSPRAVQALFPRFSWKHATYSSTVPGEHIELDLADFREVDNRLAQYAQTPQGNRKYLPYLMVNMLGEKRAPAG